MAQRDGVRLALTVGDDAIALELGKDFAQIGGNVDFSDGIGVIERGENLIAQPAIMRRRPGLRRNVFHAARGFIDYGFCGIGHQTILIGSRSANP